MVLSDHLLDRDIIIFVQTTLGARDPAAHPPAAAACCAGPRAKVKVEPGSGRRREGLVTLEAGAGSPGYGGGWGRGDPEWGCVAETAGPPAGTRESCPGSSGVAMGGGARFLTRIILPASVFGGGFFHW